MNKNEIAKEIAMSVDLLSPSEREELEKDLSKLKEKSLRWLFEHIEDTAKV